MKKGSKNKSVAFVFLFALSENVRETLGMQTLAIDRDRLESPTASVAETPSEVSGRRALAAHMPPRCPLSHEASRRQRLMQRREDAHTRNPADRQPEGDLL